ncbi:MAG: tRNA (adenosine(37)-N6)-threonylcarbamoyltransferase complex ATPase subunit type 1 TsaE [Patescibacteria group bacterium]
MTTVSITSLPVMDQFAKDFLLRISPTDTARVICLQGDLGAGKTAFVKSIAKAFGISEHITSPTFVIQKTYEPREGDWKRLVHIDAYRLESSDELAKLDWDKTLAVKGSLVMLEWPEKVADIIPEDATTLSFMFVDDTTREITL